MSSLAALNNNNALKPNSIVTNEIKMKDEAAPDAAGAAAQGGASGPAALLRNNLLMNALWSIVGGQRPHVSGPRLSHSVLGEQGRGMSWQRKRCPTCLPSLSPHLRPLLPPT